MLSTIQHADKVEGDTGKGGWRLKKAFPRTSSTANIGNVSQCFGVETGDYQSIAIGQNLNDLPIAHDSAASSEERGKRHAGPLLPTPAQLLCMLLADFTQDFCTKSRQLLVTRCIRLRIGCIVAQKVSAEHLHLRHSLQ